MSSVFPISFQRHGSKRWRPVNNFEFTSSETVIKIHGQELMLAQSSMPVGFIRSEGKYNLVAIVGLTSKRNLLVNNEGHWIGRYIPESIRSFPFLIARSPDGQEILCVDEESNLITEEPEPSDGENSEYLTFFDSEGTPSASLQEMVKFTKGIKQANELTDRICVQLEELDLIKPWRIVLQATDSSSEATDSAPKQQQLEGVYCVDQDNLNALEPDQLAALRDCGGLLMAYCQLLSMRNLSGLAEVANLVSKEGASNEVFFEDPSESGNISFENL